MRLHILCSLGAIFALSLPSNACSPPRDFVCNASGCSYDPPTILNFTHVLAQDLKCLGRESCTAVEEFRRCTGGAQEVAIESTLAFKTLREASTAHLYNVVDFLGAGYFSEPEFAEFSGKMTCAALRSCPFQIHNANVFGRAEILLQANRAVSTRSEIGNPFKDVPPITGPPLLSINFTAYDAALVHSCSPRSPLCRTSVWSKSARARVTAQQGLRRSRIATSSLIVTALNGIVDSVVESFQKSLTAEFLAPRSIADSVLRAEEGAVLDISLSAVNATSRRLIVDCQAASSTCTITCRKNYTCENLSILTGNFSNTTVNCVERSSCISVLISNIGSVGVQRNFLGYTDSIVVQDETEGDGSARVLHSSREKTHGLSPLKYGIGSLAGRDLQASVSSVSCNDYLECSRISKSFCRLHCYGKQSCSSAVLSLNTSSPCVTPAANLICGGAYSCEEVRLTSRIPVVEVFGYMGLHNAVFDEIGRLFIFAPNSGLRGGYIQDAHGLGAGAFASSSITVRNLNCYSGECAIGSSIDGVTGASMSFYGERSCSGCVIKHADGLTRTDTDLRGITYEFSGYESGKGARISNVHRLIAEGTKALYGATIIPIQSEKASIDDYSFYSGKFLGMNAGAKAMLDCTKTFRCEIRCGAVDGCKGLTVLLASDAVRTEFGEDSYSISYAIDGEGENFPFLVIESPPLTTTPPTWELAVAIAAGVVGGLITLVGLLAVLSKFQANPMTVQGSGELVQKAEVIEVEADQEKSAL